MRNSEAGVAAGRPGPNVWPVIALALFGLALVYGVYVHLATPVYPEDDAFISYRYVDNLVAGKGLVYNEGHRVFGASTPLYVLGLALVKVVLRSAPTPDIAGRLNFLSYLATGIALLLLLRSLLRRIVPAALLAALFMLRDDMLRISTGGMEAFLFVALMLFGLWALLDRRFVLSGALAGISVLARLEGVLLCALVLVAWLVELRRGRSGAGGPKPKAAAVLAGLFVPGLVWIVFGFAYYGTPVYHSIIAKSRPLYPLPLGHALGRLFQVTERYVLGDMAVRTADASTPGWRFSILTVITIVLMTLAVWGYLAGRTAAKRQKPEGCSLNQAAARMGGMAVPALFGLVLLFYLLTNPLLFPWYMPPVMVLWYLLVVTGVFRLVQCAGPRRLKAVALVLLVAWAGIVALRLPVARVLAGDQLANVGVETDPVRTRIVAYRDAAVWLNQVLPDGVTIVGPEVGSLGYYYKGPLVDACGLVSPEAVPFLPVPASERFSAECGAISVDLVRQLFPDVVVTMGTFAGISLYDDPWFKQAYTKVRTFDLPKPAWNTPTVDVFFRSDRVQPGPGGQGA